MILFRVRDTTVEVAAGPVQGGGGISTPVNGLQPDLSKLGVTIDPAIPFTGYGMQAGVQTLYTVTVVGTIYKEKVNSYGDPWGSERDRWREEPQSNTTYTPTSQGYD